MIEKECPVCRTESLIKDDVYVGITVINAFKTKITNFAARSYDAPEKIDVCAVCAELYKPHFGRDVSGMLKKKAKALDTKIDISVFYTENGELKKELGIDQFNKHHLVIYAKLLAEELAQYISENLPQTTQTRPKIESFVQILKHARSSL